MQNPINKQDKNRAIPAEAGLGDQGHLLGPFSTLSTQVFITLPCKTLKTSALKKQLKPSWNNPPKWVKNNMESLGTNNEDPAAWEEVKM